MIRNRLFEKKINYAEEAEAPMILGTKILKRIKKDWGEDSDIYYEIEDILIDLGSDSPRRLAMALKRVLTNYDMWESPYNSFNEKDEEIISKLEEICEDLDSAKLKLFFNSSDAKAIEKRFAHKIKKSPVKIIYDKSPREKAEELIRPKKKQYRNYVATFYTPNSGYGNRYACVLSELEFTGYGVSSNIVCELTFEEFYDLLKYFKFEGGEYVRDDYKSLLESQKTLSRPLFRKPTHFVKTYKDEVFDILDDLINKGDISYDDLEDIYNNGSINDEVIEYIATETNYGHSEGTKRYILEIIGEYYDNAFEEHMRDINEDMDNNTQTKNNSNNRSKNTRQSAKNRPSANYTKDIEKNKQQRTKEPKKSSNKGKAAIAGAVAGATYLGKKYIVDPISKSLGDD